MKKIIYLSILILFSIKIINAQESCGTMKYYQQQLAAHPELKEINDAFELRMQQTSLRIYDASSFKTNEVIRIPVVVHVVYQNTVQNISDAQIMSQIDALNRDFNHQNPDSLPITHPFYPIVGSAGIEFCLATVDEHLNPTTGITRTFTTNRSFNLDAGTAQNVKFASLGGVDAWDQAKYLNFWVCNLESPVLGYAQFPTSLTSDPRADGVVVGYQSFGGIGASTRPNARTAVHEVGHWLGLRHIWGDAFCGDDHVADTPPAEDKNFGCPRFPHRPNDSCGQDARGEMFMNYMDYVDDNCMNSFSKGQVAVMNEVMNNERYELKRTDNCNASVGINPLKNNEDLFKIISNINEGIYQINLNTTLYNNPMNIYVSDMLGNIIYNNSGSFDRPITIDISDKSAGMYFIHIKHKQFESSSKVMKTNN
ncbi:MAG: M43 family zinc metalloprotease [Bacteroidota bacterium]